ncbi:MAG TPA: DUF4328 domain-containing protein [Ilumatobacteraceae bacterium]|nr:DUF4328 domain-containing protein [Ilumatobacteraceae bacterium]
MGAGPTRSTRGLGMATIVLFWVTTAIGGLLMFMLINRKTVVNDFFDDASFGSISKIDDADNAVAGALTFLYVGIIASVILSCVWSIRAAGNAKARRPDLNVSPGLAGGSWFIPLGNYVVPFMQLRRAAAAIGGSLTALVFWQVGFIAWNVSFGVIASSGSAINDAKSLDDALGAIDRQVVFGVLMFVAMIVASIFAMQSIRKFDQLGEAR